MDREDRDLRAGADGVDTLAPAEAWMSVYRGNHAGRDQIPSLAPACGVGPSNRQLAGLLARRLGPTPDLLFRDGEESKKLKPELLTRDHEQAESVSVRPRAR